MILIMNVSPELPPGPRLPNAVQSAIMWVRPHRWLRRLHARYGDVFSVNVAPVGQAVYLANPADIKKVFAGDPATYRAGEANSLMRGLLGDTSVLLVDESEHRTRRKQMLPPFHREAIARQVDQMVEIADAEIARWPVGREFAVAPSMAAITLEVIMRIVIGADDPARLAKLRRVLPRVVDMGYLGLTSMMYPDLLRYPPWYGVRRDRAEMDRLLFAEIADRRADPNLAGRTDVLSMLVRAGDENGATMSDAQLRDQLATLLFAGHETTATGLTWALERLTRHPEALRRAVAAADSDDDEYLDALVKETLRIRPVVHEVGRVVHEPVELGGYRIPAGTMVAPAIGLVHASDEVYPDAEGFDPERMLPGSGTKVTPTTWLPFGGGTRRCLGATFAQVEMRVVLREILRRVELETTEQPGERQRVKHVTLTPHRGGRVRVRTRRPVTQPREGSLPGVA
jgi:cytochrome P450